MALYAVDNWWLVSIAVLPIAIASVFLLRKLERSFDNFSDGVLMPASAKLGRFIGRTFFLMKRVKRDAPPVIGSLLVIAIVLSRAILPLLVVIALIIFIF